MDGIEHNIFIRGDSFCVVRAGIGGSDGLST